MTGARWRHEPCGYEYVDDISATAPDIAHCPNCGYGEWHWVLVGWDER